jgi:hypothetical protein
MKVVDEDIQMGEAWMRENVDEKVMRRRRRDKRHVDGIGS